MFSRSPSVQIDKVDKIEISIPLDPFWARALVDYLGGH